MILHECLHGVAPLHGHVQASNFFPYENAVRYCFKNRNPRIVTVLDRLRCVHDSTDPRDRGV